MAAWKAQTLDPGETAEAVIALDGESMPGHHRHLIWVVGADPRNPLARLLVTADAVERGGSFRIAPARIDLGRVAKGATVKVTVTVETGSLPPGSFRVASDLGPVRPSSFDVDGGSRRVNLTLTLKSHRMSGRLRVRSEDGSEASATISAFPPRLAPAPLTAGPLLLDGPGTLDGFPLLDLGETGLGELAEGALRVRNRGPDPVRLRRCFAGGSGGLEVAFEPVLLASGETADIRIRTRGTDPPGAWRGFVHLFTDHPEASHVQVACAGTVVLPPKRPSRAERVTVAWIPGEPGPPRIEIRDGRGEVRSVAVADHHTFDSEPGEEPPVCSNASVGFLPEARPEGLALPVRVLSVVGDEAVEDAWVPHLRQMEDPAGAVIEAIHDTEDPDGPAFGGLTVAVFHDHAPAAREAARRTRVPALFMAAGEKRRGVERVRDVVVWSLDPAQPDRLLLHVRAGTILAVGPFASGSAAGLGP